MNIVRIQTRERQAQLSLGILGNSKGKIAKEHGGESYVKIHERKTARPFDPAKPLTVTMKSSRAVGERSMLHPRRARLIKEIVYRAGRRHGVIIKRYVSVGNHLHILVQTKARRMIEARPALRAFLREVSGLVSRLMTGARKGHPAGGKFWDYLAWSRVVEWGRDLAGIYRYFTKNEHDAIAVLFENNWPAVPVCMVGPP